MKGKLTYLIAALIILGVVAIPAISMNKVFSPESKGRQVAGDGINGGGPGNVTDQGLTSPGLGEITPGSNQISSGSGQTSHEEGQIPSGAATGLTETAAKEGTAASMQQQAVETGAAPGEAAPASAEGTTVSPPAAAEKNCPVWIAVVGKNSEQLFQAGQVFLTEDNEWGINALGALEATGLPYVTSPTWRDFVYSISGQANSGVSGWMYSVNGDAPMHMADKHPVKAGDKVIWWYSHSMEQPQPRWDELIQ